MIPHIKRYIENHWGQFFEVEPESIQYLLISNPQGKKITHGKCTVLIFKNNEKRPVLVCKFLRSKECEENKLIKEHQILIQLKSWGKSPYPFVTTNLNGKKVTIEKYENGISVKSALLREVNKFCISDLGELLILLKEDFFKTAKLIRELQDLKYDYNQKVTDYTDRALVNKNVLFSSLSLTSNQIIALDRIIDSYIGDLNDRCLVHGDLTPSNILKSNDELRVIDFEFGNYSKHKFIDPLRFIFYYFILLYELNLFGERSCEESFYYFFKESIETSSIVNEFVSSTLDISKEKNLFYYFSLFLLSNLQLQLEEVDFINNAFLKQTQNLITICLNLAENQEPDLQPYKNSTEMYSLEELRHQLKEKQNEITKYKKAINEMQSEKISNMKYIEHCHNVIQQKDVDLENNVKYIEKCHLTIEEKDRELQMNIDYINKCHLTISEKDNELENHKRYMDERMEEKEHYINSIESELTMMKQVIYNQDEKINELLHQLNTGPFKRLLRKIRKR